MNILKNIINDLEDNKAKDIVSIDVKEKTSITDYMIFATGTSNRHIHSLSRSIYAVSYTHLTLPTKRIV